MKYNFDEVIDRSQNRSSKYDEREKVFGTMDVMPPLGSGYGFRTAQPIIDACRKKAEKEFGAIHPVPQVILKLLGNGKKNAISGILIPVL